MKKTLSVLVAVGLLALGRPPEAYAFDGFLFNNAAGDLVSVPNVVQVGGDAFCELKIDAAAGTQAHAVVTIYSAVELDSSGNLKNPAIWFRATNPINGDPDNHLGGPCPNFVGGVISSYTDGNITVKLRSKK
jgi:hypothetical protein